MKKNIIISIILFAVVGSFAQERSRGDRHRSRAKNPGKIISQFFAFDETQSATFQELLEARKTGFAPIRQEQKAISEALKDLLLTENPDPSAVGELVLQKQELKEQTRVVNQIFADGFIQMLNEEQTQKLANLTRAQRLIPVVKAAKALKIPLNPPPKEGGEQ